MLVAAAALNANGVTEIATAAAEALRPLAGDAAFPLFAFGVVGSGFLAIPALGGSAAYAVSEMLGGAFSLDQRFRRAPGFYGIAIVATLCGAALDFAAIPSMKLLLRTALFNGIIAPPFLFAMMAVVGSEAAMSAYVASFPLKIMGWTATAAMTLADLLLAISMLGSHHPQGVAPEARAGPNFLLACAESSLDAPPTRD